MQQYSKFKKFKTNAGTIENPIFLSELLRVQLLNIFFALFTYKLYKWKITVKERNDKKC